MSNARIRFLCLLALLCGCARLSAGAMAQVKEIQYISSADQSQQPAMFYAPPSADPVPLIVALHTWSGNYKQPYHKAIEAWCVTNAWAYIHPDFRGPNKRPEATGSDLVVADIVSAVEYAKKRTRIDSSAVYLVGTSGGGYSALLMAGRHPDIWAGVSAWVPISDLKAWYDECERAGRHYSQDIAASCGGPPGTSSAVDNEYIRRSPLKIVADTLISTTSARASVSIWRTGWRIK